MCLRFKISFMTYMMNLQKIQRSKFCSVKIKLRWHCEKETFLYLHKQCTDIEFHVMHKRAICNIVLSIFVTTIYKFLAALNRSRKELQFSIKNIIHISLYYISLYILYRAAMYQALRNLNVIQSCRNSCCNNTITEYRLLLIIAPINR